MGSALVLVFALPNMLLVDIAVNGEEPVAPNGEAVVLVALENGELVLKPG